MKNFLSPQVRLVFVCLEENHSVPFLESQRPTFSSKEVEILEIPQLTDGQATTAYLSKHLWKENGPLLIYNIDTYARPRSLRPSDIRLDSDGCIPCFRAPGDHWSFVELGNDGWATRVVEKERISEFASLGLYWFSDTELFLNSYEKSLKLPYFKERYVAPLYQLLLQEGKKISMIEIPSEDVHCLGTPAELQDFLSLSHPPMDL